MKNKTIIKLVLALLLCTVVIISNLDTTFSPDSQNNYMQYSSIAEAIAAFEETVELDEWFEWFNSLTQEEQEMISYRPSNFEEIQREKYGIIIDTPNNTLFDPVTIDNFQPTPAPMDIK